MRIVNLTKSYENRMVLDRVNLELEEGGIYGLMGASGRGKTTLLHILMGLVQAEEGTVEGIQEKRFSAVFQENRLCEFLTAGENVAVVQRRPRPVEEINQILEEILPRETLSQPVREFSGGMKRRAAIARALLAESEILVMDEPFTGLDENTKGQVLEFLLKYRKGRTLIFATHQEEELELLGAEKILL